MMRQLNKLHPAIWISFIGRLFLMAALIILFPLMSKLKLSSCLESSTKYSSASATHSSKSTIVAMYSITFNTLPSFGTGPKNKDTKAHWLSFAPKSLRKPYLQLQRYASISSFFNFQINWKFKYVRSRWGIHLKKDVTIRFSTFHSFSWLLSFSFF